MIRPSPLPRILIIALALIASGSATASAVCMNKYIYRGEGNRQILTLLTGKLTFQEAQDLSKQIAAKKSPPLEWLDDKGKTIAVQFGELKVLRPMPVACEERSSGVVVAVTFPTTTSPGQKIQIKLDPSTVVVFDEQKQ